MTMIPDTKAIQDSTLATTPDTLATTQDISQTRGSNYVLHMSKLRMIHTDNYVFWLVYEL